MLWRVLRIDVAWFESQGRLIIPIISYINRHFVIIHFHARYKFTKFLLFILLSCIHFILKNGIHLELNLIGFLRISSSVVLAQLASANVVRKTISETFKIASLTFWISIIKLLYRIELWLELGSGHFLTHEVPLWIGLNSVGPRPLAQQGRLLHGGLVTTIEFNEWLLELIQLEAIFACPSLRLRLSAKLLHEVEELGTHVT